MKKELTQKDIDALVKLEEKARDIQSRLDAVRRKWELQIVKLKGKEYAWQDGEYNKIWTEYCAAKGISVDYEFRDLLC